MISVFRDSRLSFNCLSSGRGNSTLRRLVLKRFPPPCRKGCRVLPSLVAEHQIKRVPKVQEAHHHQTNNLSLRTCAYVGEKCLVTAILDERNIKPRPCKAVSSPRMDTFKVHPSPTATIQERGGGEAIFWPHTTFVLRTAMSGLGSMFAQHFKQKDGGGNASLRSFPAKLHPPSTFQPQRTR